MSIFRSDLCQTLAITKFNIAICIVIGSQVCIAETTGSWYLKGGIAINQFSETHFRDMNCTRVSPAALYGCGKGVNGEPYQARGRFESTGSIDAGVGFYVTPTIRLETQLIYLSSMKFDGATNFLAPERRQTVDVDVSAVTALVFVHFDFQGFELPFVGRVVPSIGVGSGIVHSRVQQTTMTFPRTRTIVPGEQNSRPFYVLSMGISNKLSESTVLEVSWSYQKYDRFTTGNGHGRVEWIDGSRDPIALNLAATEAAIGGQKLGLALRYLL